MPFLAATPVWATILVAVVAGGFGLLSGVAAAAAITTRHETRERFRERMIEAADAFVTQEIKATTALESAYRRIGMERAKRAPTWPPLYREVASLEDLTRELENVVPRLFIVFRSRAPSESAAGTSYLINKRRLALKRFAESQHSDDFNEATNLLGSIGEARNAAHVAFNREIRRRRLL
jgi:hypothetical protein